MPFSLLPRHLLSGVTDITPDFLHKQGIRLLMLDFDNTLVPYTTSTPTKAVSDWLDTMLRSDVKICVVSNSRKDRVKKFCQTYGVPCITHAKKPFSKGISQCLAQFGISAECSALVGDQIYTDTLGANCAGLTSILVPAICNHTFWLKLRHVAELPFIYAAKLRRKTK